ncbi:uncharacterized protein P174DRAFT_427982 [Aspergillus novofumigatus IBT 16806]|uniref:Uncharacterized protein n=1 Tax=Aspergillus novofumigatus (strain IBT 16806) TaxID=1392255 RepID=A0A2I1CFP8_ASPN1|nr:uncharacterized protein P174DRAFT_427982 [Aspergillus novofumigatus IBT 16806]PKX96431.1 hypothetical protein P174DRAFT_427982 [Aspergillus novofumigatus IBT 16806]
MSCLTSSLVESSLQKFSQLISSGRLTPYEDEVALVLWQYELRRLRRWAEEAEWWSLYRLWEAPGIEDQLLHILHRLQQALVDIQDALNNNTADVAMSADTNDNDAGRTKMQMIYLSLRETINCLNQIMVIIEPVHRPSFDPTILENEALLSILLRAPDLSKDKPATQQLFALWSYLLNTLAPLYDCLIREPPPDQEICNALHRRFVLTILAQMSLAKRIEMSGDGLRDLRQAVIREAQKVRLKVDQVRLFRIW